MFWNELQDLQISAHLEGVLWIIGGDFNQTTHPTGHSQPHINHLTKKMVDFRECFLNMGVFDLRFRGVSHTLDQ